MSTTQTDPRGRFPRRALFAPLVAWAVLAMSFGARAQEPAAEVPGQVMIVLGSTEGSGTAPELAGLQALQKPPFDAFPKKALLKQVGVTLATGQDREIELPNGRKLRLSLVEKMADGRYRVSVSINRPGKQDYLPVMTVVAAPGDPFFVAGQKYEGGTLIIGVRVGKAG